MFKVWVIIFLFICTVLDIKTRRLPVWFMIVGNVAAVVFRLLNWGQNTALWIGGIVIGIVFLLLSKWTKEGFGYGDSWMILILGISLGLWDILLLLSIALSCAGLLALFLLARGKWSQKVAFPFVPFLMLGYVGVLYL